MTDEGARLLEKLTTANLKHRLAIVLDGKLLVAPMITGPISRSVMLTLPALEQNQLFSLEDRMHAAISALPTNQTAPVEKK